MNKLRQSIKLVLFISVASLFFASCSDDDDKSIPVPKPSRMITGIKVHKICGCYHLSGNDKPHLRQQQTTDPHLQQFTVSGSKLHVQREL